MSHSVRKWKNKSVESLIEETGYEDPIYAIKELSRNVIMQASQVGWSGPPFDPLELCKYLDMDISPNEDIVDARTIPLGKSNFRIEYNPYQTVNRVNFSICHEIGHTFFSDCSDRIRNREKVLGDPWELEFLCNIAASELLLPYSIFKNEANELPLNINSLIEISGKYKASLEAVFLRFCEVSTRPCAIAISSFDGENLIVDYFKKSNTFDAEIENDFILPISSAYDCLNSGWTANQTDSWTLKKGFHYNFHFIGLAHLKKTNTKRVGIFIVPENDNQKAGNELYEVFGDATQPRGNGNKIIVQVLNSHGALGSGFGKSMAKKWPKSKNEVDLWKKNKAKFKLGNNKMTQLNEDTHVFQMIVQKGLFPKKGETLLRYLLLRKGLIELRQRADILDASVHMPRIGAGQAGGNWTLISGIVYEELVQEGVEVTIYNLPGTQIKKRQPNSLTLFDENSLYE